MWASSKPGRIRPPRASITSPARPVPASLRGRPRSIRPFEDPDGRGAPGRRRTRAVDDGESPVMGSNYHGARPRGQYRLASTGAGPVPGRPLDSGSIILGPRPGDPCLPSTTSPRASSTTCSLRRHVLATAIGEHRYDDRWPDTSEAGRVARLARLRPLDGDLRGAGPIALTAAERIDRDLVLGELAELRFAGAELREETWDPLAWVYLIGGGSTPLSAASSRRSPRAWRRWPGGSRACRRIIGDAQVVLGSHPDRPVSRLHAEIAGKADRRDRGPGARRRGHGRGGGAGGPRRRGAPAPAPGGGRPARRPRSTAIGRHLRDRGRAERHGVGAPGPRPVRRQAPPHAA